MACWWFSSWLTVGAIMFGDPLLPSECCLIIEELKATSLCFQVRTVGCSVSYFRCYSVFQLWKEPFLRWIKPSLAVCSWAPDHGAYSERRISPRRASEAPNAERKAGGDLARLGAPRAQPWACSDAPQTIEKAAPWPVAVGPYRMVEVR